jgi:hypothetical protein
MRKVWGSSGARFWCSLVGHTNWVRAAVLSRDTRLAASASDDKTVKLWDIHTHQCVQTYYEHNLPVRAVKFHPHGSVVASAGVDNSIKLYDLRSHQMIQHYTAHDSVVNSIDFHPSGDYLLSGSDDSALKIWDLREGHQLYTIHGHKGATLGVQWSPEGDFFASAGADQRVMTWATNFDKVAASADPTMQARRKKVHIAPSSAEKMAREQFDQTQGGAAHSQQQSDFQLGFDGPRTIHADALPGGYGSSMQYGGGSPAASYSGSSTSYQPRSTIPQPQPHPEMFVDHDCAYDHAHGESDAGKQHAFDGRANPITTNGATASMPGGGRYNTGAATIPANAQALYPPPANAPVRSMAGDPSQTGPHLLHQAGADLTAVRLPDHLTSTLHQIVSQLDVISKTVRDMEERLALHEHKMEDLETRAIVKERNERHQQVLAEQQREMEQRQAQQRANIQAQVRSPGH